MERIGIRKEEDEGAIMVYDCTNLHESIWIPRIVSSPTTLRTSLATRAMHAGTSGPATPLKYGTSCMFSTMTPCTPLRL